MYTLEIILKNNPIAVSVQRKEKEAADALFAEIKTAIATGEPRFLELTCEKQEGKKLVVLTSEITAIQVSEKTGATSNLGVGFARS